MEISALAMRRVQAAFEQLDLPLPALLQGLPEKGWLPASDALAWLRDAGGEPLPPALRFQIAERTLQHWYHEAAGFAQCPQAIDVLRHHVRLGSFSQFARGEGIGRFALLAIDEAAGTASVHSSTPFCRDWERGLIQGALDAAGDLLYSDVQWDEPGSQFRLRFVSEDNRARVPWALGEPEESRLWRLRNRVRQLEQQNAALAARAKQPQRRAPPAAAIDWLDPQTGASSEAHLVERLQQLARAPLPARCCLVAYGLTSPGSGDAMRQLASAGLRISRRDDLLARLGEHDLALLLQDIDESTAQRVALRMVDGLQAQLARQQRLSVTPWTGGDVSLMVKAAKASLR